MTSFQLSSTGASPHDGRCDDKKSLLRLAMPPARFSTSFQSSSMIDSSSLPRAESPTSEGGERRGARLLSGGGEPGGGGGLPGRRSDDASSPLPRSPLSLLAS